MVLIIQKMKKVLKKNKKSKSKTLIKKKKIIKKKENIFKLIASRFRFKTLFYIVIFLIIFILIIIFLKSYINNNIKESKKRKIYVQYLDFWPSFEKKKFDIHNILKERYRVVITNKPDYVFFGQFGIKNRNVSKDCIKIFVSIENRIPDFSKTDYAIGLLYMQKDDRYYRRPTGTGILSEIYSVYNVNKKNGIDLKKKKFCGWVVTNNRGYTRNKFYKKLSEYKNITSGGLFLNNIGWRVSNKRKFLRDFKFSICFENSKTDGYVSEKIYDAFEAGTIPIYYGDDTLLQILNNKSYIHIKNTAEFDEKIELIKKIDQNDTLYEEMTKEKIVLDDNKFKIEEQKYKDFIYRIIDQDKQLAKRYNRENSSNIDNSNNNNKNITFYFK